MSGSMSVHSLIDKFSEEDSKTGSSGQRPQRRSLSSPATGTHSRSRSASPSKAAAESSSSASHHQHHRTGSTSHSTPYLHAASNPQHYRASPANIPGAQPAPVAEPHLQHPFQHTPRRSQQPALFPPGDPSAVPQAVGQPFRAPLQPQSLESILGPQFASVPFTDASLVEALKLRTEQERTRQESLRLELASRNLAIIQSAVQNDVPPHMIASMCVGPIPEAYIQQQLQQTQQARAQQHQQYQFPPRSEKPRGSSADISKSPFVAPDQPVQPGSSAQGASPRVRGQDLDNASLVAPSNFKFGAGSSAGRRPLSPAKIETVSAKGIEKSSMERSGPRTRSSTHSSKSSHLQSPLGATSSIQVRPLPAQPLHKQARTTQAPSQESMTSFQHVIQFHHWKPEYPGGQPPQQQSERDRLSQPSHKRHKSSDMSVDLTNQREGTPQRVAPNPSLEMKHEDADVSMDAGDETITEAPKRRDNDTNSDTSQSSGRFPHDILSSN
ncbi:hypothetical protein ACI3LZ_001418 [Candidozyma auris]